jgi:hypothetical protein
VASEVAGNEGVRIVAILQIVLAFAVQALDVALHVATDQFELIRAASNLVAVCGATGIFFTSKHARSAWLLASASYLLLNAIFIAQNGVINPVTGDLRLPLIGFVIVTLIVLYWSWQRVSGASKPID